MGNVKVFAMYLPQFHEIPENSSFWGKGFTDWVSVKQSYPLFKGHVQPQVPLNDNYYDLSFKQSIVWQAELAKEYGISGWGIYHYWFNTEQQVLTKPAQLILENKEIDIPFFFAWDNASWKRTWSKLKGNAWSPNFDNEKRTGPEILIEYKIGTEEDWKKHFEYLFPFFKDRRYIKHNNKPLFLIYNYSDSIRKMSLYWDELAKENGFSGIEVIYSYNPLHGIPRGAYKFKYEPLYSGWGTYIDRAIRLLNKKQKKIKKYSYDTIWRRIIYKASICKDKKMFYGAFVSYDDSPRRGNKGKIVVGYTKEKFEKYLWKLINICEKQEKEYIFLTAWNEWGEGAHLEPDEQYGYDYLTAYKLAITKGKIK